MKSDFIKVQKGSKNRSEIEQRQNRDSAHG